MFVTTKPLRIQPARLSTIQPGEQFEIPSGMGGLFVVRFDGYQGDRAEFTIVSSSPPPEGWQGQKRSFIITDLPEKLTQWVPDTPWYDGGARELAALKHLGYPEDSDELTTLRRRCPNLPA